jgi:hypothetical protein
MVSVLGRYAWAAEVVAVNAKPVEEETSSWM